MCPFFILFVVDGDLNGLTKMALHSINLTTCRKNVASLKCCSYSNRFYDGNYLGEKKQNKTKVMFMMNFKEIRRPG